ncbi:hypothetical protein KAM471c_14100 [Aeromonas caviae]|nr:hypothetical protein KAM471c_14100 [Aeromonas caviae]
MGCTLVSPMVIVNASVWQESQINLRAQAPPAPLALSLSGIGYAETLNGSVPQIFYTPEFKAGKFETPLFTGSGKG